MSIMRRLPRLILALAVVAAVGACASAPTTTSRTIQPPDLGKGIQPRAPIHTTP